MGQGKHQRDIILPGRIYLMRKGSLQTYRIWMLAVLHQPWSSFLLPEHLDKFSLGCFLATPYPWLSSSPLTCPWVSASFSEYWLCGLPWKAPCGVKNHHQTVERLPGFLSKLVPPFGCSRLISQCFMYEHVNAINVAALLGLRCSEAAQTHTHTHQQMPEAM